MMQDLWFSIGWKTILPDLTKACPIVRAPQALIPSPEKIQNRFSEIGDGDGAIAVVEFFGWIDSHGAVDSGKQVRNADRFFDDFLTQTIGHSVGSFVVQSASGKND